MKNTIRLLCVSTLFFLSGTVVFSQQIQHNLELPANHDYESQIRMVYGDEWMSVNPGAVEFLKVCLSSRVRYKEEALTPDDKYPLLSSFPLMNKNNPQVTAINYPDFDPETFVAITYNLPFYSNMTQVIRVDGTNYLIVIDPINTQH